MAVKLVKDRYKINNVVIWQPDKDLAFSFATTYTESSQRSQYGVGYFTPLFTVEQYGYKATNIPVSEAAKILQMIAKGYKFTLHYFSPYYGVWRDGQFYVGQSQNVSIGELSEDEQTLSTLEFNMTGVNPL